MQSFAFLRVSLYILREVRGRARMRCKALQRPHPLVRWIAMGAANASKL